jgi:hypothetical protein
MIWAALPMPAAQEDLRREMPVGECETLTAAIVMLAVLTAAVALFVSVIYRIVRRWRDGNPMCQADTPWI